MAARLALTVALGCVARGVVGIPKPDAGPDQVVTIPHDGTWATHTHNTWLNGTSTDPNGDPLTHFWICNATALVYVGCVTSRLQLNNYGGANDHPFVAYNDTCRPTYEQADSDIEVTQTTDKLGRSKSGVHLHDHRQTHFYSAQNNGVPNTRLDLNPDVVNYPEANDFMGNEIHVDGGARPWGSQPPPARFISVTSSDVNTRVLLPAGTHTCVLTSTDSYNVSVSDEVIITVNPEPNLPPVADAGFNQTIIVPHDLDHTAGTANCMDPNGHTGFDTVDDTSGNGDNIDALWDDQTPDILLEVDPKRHPQATSCQRTAHTKWVQVQLNASNSTDPEGDPMRYRWTCPGSKINTTDKAPVIWLSKDQLDTQWESSYAAYSSCCPLLPFFEYESVGVGACMDGNADVIPYIKANGLNAAHCQETCSETASCTAYMFTNSNECRLAVIYNDLTVNDAAKMRESDHLITWAPVYQSRTLVSPTQGSNQTNIGNCFKRSASRAASAVNMGCQDAGGTATDCILQCNDLAHCTAIGKAACDGIPACAHIEINTARDTVTLKTGPPSCDVSAPNNNGRDVSCTRPTEMTWNALQVHRCTVTVEDTYGMWAQAVTDIRIQEEPNQQPVVNAGPDFEVTVPHDGDPNTNVVMVTLNGTLTSDADGDRMDYHWSCKIHDGPPAYATGTDRVTVLPLKGPDHVLGGPTHNRRTLGQTHINECTLTATDTYGKTDTDVVLITTRGEPNNQAVPRAGSDQTYTIPHDGDPDTTTVLVTLDGYSSDDTEDYMSPDGTVKLVTKDDILTYHWSCPTGAAGGAIESTDATTVVPMVEGVHDCTLTVTDTYGTTKTDVVRITVNKEPNTTPLPRAGTDQTYTIPHDGDPATTTVLVTLDGYASSDTEDYMSPDGNVKQVSKDDVLTYHWNCPTGAVNGAVVSTDATTVVPMVEGVHQCTLTVTDTYGAVNAATHTGQASDIVQITVQKEPNLTPIVRPGTDQSYTVPHDGDRETNTVMVTLDGSATSDTEQYKSPDGTEVLVNKDDVLTYHWNCPTGSPNGPITSTDATTVVPMVAGTHTCTLTVTDTYGAVNGATNTGQAAQSITITIYREPNTTPQPNAGPDQTYTVPHDGRTFTNTVLVTLNGSATADVEDYYSPDGKVVWETKSDRLDYQWSCVTDGLTGTSYTSTDVITVIPMIAGTHTCTITVSDTYGPGYNNPTTGPLKTSGTGQASDSAVITVHPEPNMGYS